MVSDRPFLVCQAIALCIDSHPIYGGKLSDVLTAGLTSWDLGGQPRFRTMWERYCRGVNAIVYALSTIPVHSVHTNLSSRFIVDSADRAALPVARDELHALLEKPVLDGIPLLVLGNKTDLPDKLSVDEIIDEMDLRSVS